jgi:negative regulator of flagellin synthesis FlgM
MYPIKGSIDVKISRGGSAKPVSPAGVSAGKPSGPQAPAAPSPTRDTVDITSVSAQLAQVEKALSGIGIVDVARVDAIKQAISEGRFRIDADVVADKLLASVREFLAAAGHRT